MGLEFVGAGFRLELDAFVDEVRAGDSDAPRSPCADALRTFEVTMTVPERIGDDQ